MRQRHGFYLLGRARTFAGQRPQVKYIRSAYRCHGGKATTLERCHQYFLGETATVRHVHIASGQRFLQTVDHV
jgi:hypothetical protein